ncbi:hypothetical protein [Fluviicola taffensis]|uniref:hypothetical protein n=1 Tax=Fluviicola taffensis TaxID=191579 RepID=UPI003137A84C
MGLLENMEFKVRDTKVLFSALTSLFNLCKEELPDSLENWLIEDFGGFLSKGKWRIHNTYNGGILFLREPETIVEIRLEFSSELKTALAIVEFDTEIRNKRNTKYKPNAGKTEQAEWNLEDVFTHFTYYPQKVQIYLISALAKIGKEICEKQNKESWYMKYTSDFQIKAILNGEVVDCYDVLNFAD